MDTTRSARLARAVAIAGVVVASLLASACTHLSNSSPSARPVDLSSCGGALRSQPPVVDVSCSDNGITARRLHWSGWGGPVATATGSAVVDLCAYEECYAGDYVTVPIVVITSKLMRCPGKREAYSKLQYVFVGSSPYKGLSPQTSVADGSIVPSDPADQTAKLSC